MARRETIQIIAPAVVVVVVNIRYARSKSEVLFYHPPAASAICYYVASNILY